MIGIARITGGGISPPPPMVVPVTKTALLVYVIPLLQTGKIVKKYFFQCISPL